jgi:hypothetical protein
LPGKTTGLAQIGVETARRSLEGLDPKTAQRPTTEACAASA